jgi:hypothetical protein
MNYLKWGALGAAGVLVADMAGSLSVVQNMGATGQKLARLAAGGLTVGLVHKFLIKGTA